MRSDALALLPVFAAAPLLRTWHMRWGASDVEAQRPMPGDEIVPNAVISTRATLIEAPPAVVWPWLVQMGQDRAGFYSYDWLERLAGAGIRNSDRIVPEWQHLAPGDLMRTYRYVARFEPLGWTVVTIDEGRALVVRNEKSTWSWAVVLDPAEAGATRLIARTRASRKRFVGSLSERLLAEPMHFVMEVGVLRGIKHRAEALQAGRTEHLIDRFAPDTEFADTIEVTVSTSAGAIFDAAMKVTTDEMPAAKALGTLRYLPGRLLGRKPPVQDGAPFIAMLLSSGTVVLEEEPDREIVFGSAGKYHQLLDQAPRPFETEAQFLAFDDPDYQQLVMSLRVEPTITPGFNRLVLEHRTHPLSAASRRRFRRYWRVIKPSGAFVTKQLLRAIKRRAEARSHS